MRLDPPVWDEDVKGTRVWDDGVDAVFVVPMIYNHRVVIGPSDDKTGYEHGWCYPSAVKAIAAAIAFDPYVDDEPVGYLKRATPGHRRATGARASL